MHPILQHALSDWRPSPMTGEQETAFDLHCNDRLARLATIFGVSTLTCGTLWWPIDRIVFAAVPEFMAPFTAWRTVVCVVAATYLVASRLPPLRRRVGTLFAVSFAVVCATVGYCSGLVGGPSGPFFNMLTVLPFATVPIPLRLSTRVVHTVGFCVALLAGCLVPFPEYRASPHLPMAISFLVWVAAISVTFGHASFLVLRSNFSQAALLSESNARLEERVAERTHELRELVARLETAREEERSRIARELHDQLGQELTAQRLTLAIAEECLDGEPATARDKLAEMRRLLDGMMSTVRALIGDLRPWILHDLGLGEAAQWLVRRTEELAGIRTEIVIEGDPRAASAEQSAAAFRILQESLTNVTKHAHATSVSVHMTTTEDALELRVRDDGIGPSERGRSVGFGVVGMRERAQALGGEFSLQQAASGGTEVTCRLPRHEGP